MTDLNAQFGDIDIYLFDQLLRGRIRAGMRVLDAGCGSGRNLVYLLREGFEVFGADSDPRAIEATRRLAASLAPTLPVDNFRLEAIEAMSFPDAAFADVAINKRRAPFCPHERRSLPDHAAGYLAGFETRRNALLPPRIFDWNRESNPAQCGAPLTRLPDGSERYLVDEALLLTLTDQLGGRLGDPLKTTVVQDQRSMTTWIVRKA